MSLELELLTSCSLFATSFKNKIIGSTAQYPYCVGTAEPGSPYVAQAGLEASGTPNVGLQVRDISRANSHR